MIGENGEMTYDAWDTGIKVFAIGSWWYINKKRVVFLRLNSNSGDREEDLLHKKALKRPQLIILRYVNAFFNCTNFAHCRPQLCID